MSDVFGNVVLPLDSADETLLYTCPLVSSSVSMATAGDPVDDVSSYAGQAVTQTQITSIIACAHTADTYSIFLTPGAVAPASIGGGAVSTDYALFYNVSVAVNFTDVVSPGIVMSPGQSLWAEATTLDTMTITVNYIEIS
jgi:hypothetical protein